jgi:hypothetical protein
LHLCVQGAHVNASTPWLSLLVAGMACVSLIVGAGVAALSARECARGERTFRGVSSDLIWMAIPTCVVAVILMWSLSSRHGYPDFDRSVDFASTASRRGALP